MSLMNKEEIMQILKIVSESKLDEFHLETGDLKLIAKRHPRMEPAGGKQAAPETLAGTPVIEQKPVPAPPKTDIPAPAPLTRPAQKESEVVVEEGLTAIRSPMLGTFYQAPKPDAPPFVEVGRFVTEEDVVCIVEVMKLFNTVKAGVRGRIAKICAENAQMVEYKQVLFLIDEAAEEGKRERSA